MERTFELIENVTEGFEENDITVNIYFKKQSCAVQKVLNGWIILDIEKFLNLFM